MLKLIIGSVVLAFCISGCSIGMMNNTSTLAEPSFAEIEMKGTITDATRCVGRYWQKAAINELSDMWEVRTYSYQVEVSGVHLGEGAPPVGLVIDFQEKDGRTFAYAHLHRMFKNDSDRRDTTIKALNACKVE